MTERRGRNRRQLQDDINEKTGYCKLEEELGFEQVMDLT